jgi:hypothetical protein
MPQARRTEATVGTIDAGDVEVARHLDGVQPGRAAEAQEREAARVDAPADRHQPDAVGHGEVDEPVDAGGGLVMADPERLSDPAHRRLCCRRVEPAPAAQEAAGVEKPKDEVGVGDGRLCAASAVAGGTRDGAGALGADAQGARLDAGDRAAARPDADDVEGAKRDPLPSDSSLGGERRLAARDQRDVCRGAAHVEGHEVGNLEELGAAACPGDAAGRTGQNRSGCEPRRFLDGRHAAVGQDDEERAGVVRLRQAPGEVRQVLGDRRADIGVDHRGRGALKFLDLGQNLARQGDEDARQLVLEHAPRFRLVGRVAVGVQVADGDGLDAIHLQGRHRLVERVPVEWRQDRAVDLHSLPDAEPALAGHEGLRRREAEVVALVLQALAHLQHVAMALRGEEADAGTLALQERVGRDRGAVDDALRPGKKVWEGEIQARGERLQAFDDADRLVGRGGGRLGDRRPAGAVDGNEVGEGAADVDPDPEIRRHGLEPVRT